MSTERIDSEEQGGSLRAAVVAAGARWSAGQRQLVRLVAELEASAEWTLDGSATCAHWVAKTLDIEVSTVREWLRIGRALSRLPVTRVAFEDGRLSYSKLRALTRVATPENEAELCKVAQQVPAGRLRHAIAAWLQRHESPEETEARHQAARGFWSRLDIDGMGFGCLRLPPERWAAVVAAIDAEVQRCLPRNTSADAPEGRATWPTAAQQRADALVALLTGGGAAVATEVVIHVRADGCTLDDGTPIAGSVVERVVSDAYLRVLIHDAQSRPINASGRHRYPSTRQRRVVRERDQACVDCGATEFLQYDHEPDFEQTRRTLVDEIRLRCRSCHRARHREERNRS